MNKVEKTVDLHMNGGLNCAQAIIAAFGEAFGVDLKTRPMVCHYLHSLLIFSGSFSILLFLF